MNPELHEKQLLMCKRFGVEPFPTPSDLKVGIARNVKDGVWPIQGLRHPPQGDTSGWYFFAGEDMSRDPDFFLPLHMSHLENWCPLVMPYLQLPPGWGFVLAPGYEDVYFNERLLQV